MVVHPSQPTFQLPEPEPKSTLGRVLLVFMKMTDRAGNRKWTLSSLLEALSNNGWRTGEEDLKATLQYLLQTGIVEPVAAGSRGVDYRFVGRERVIIQPQNMRIDVP